MFFGQQQHLHRFAAGLGTSLEVGIVGPDVTHFTDDPPGAEGDRFCWIARAFGGGEISESSGEACASVPITTVEPEPTKPGKRTGQKQ
ncbi:MAG: hypothetical protein WD688_24280 [Candidatus Binatia bacterium]